MRLFALIGALVLFVIAAAAPQDQPLFPGDDASFVKDVTYPDGSTVKAGSKLTMIRRIYNAGSVTWKNRELRLFGESHGFKVVKPKQFSAATYTEVDASVDLVAPTKPGHYRVYFKQWAKDRDGKWKLALPNKKGVYLDVVVK